MNQEQEIYRNLIYDTAMSRTPVAAMCNLTYRCPLNCKHCYVADYDPGAAELDLAEYRSLFDQLAAMETLFLTLSGGEPLLHPDFLDILAAARERGFAVRVFTGGAALDERLAAEIAALYPIAVEISLHAATPALHDEFVGVEGTWERAVAMARLLGELGANVILKMNVMNFNYGEMKGVYEIARSCGAEFRYSPYLSVTNDGGTGPLALRMSDEQLRDYFRIVKDWVVALSKDGDACDEELSSPVRYNKRALSCLAGFNNCSIGPYGTVWPCVSLPFALGNVREQPLAEIWRGDEVERVRALTDAVVEECASCELDRYCFRCPAFSVLEEGDIAKASREHCRIAQAAREILRRPLR